MLSILTSWSMLRDLKKRPPQLARHNVGLQKISACITIDLCSKARECKVLKWSVLSQVKLLNRFLQSLLGASCTAHLPYIIHYRCYMLSPCSQKTSAHNMPSLVLVLQSLWLVSTIAAPLSIPTQVDKHQSEFHPTLIPRVSAVIL